MAPLISVVMSVHNGMPYLPEAVDSILCQTYEDFEFIIIDDGSTDRSPEFLDDAASKDVRLKIVHQKQRGIPESLNTALKQANGLYIARMDADDISYPNRFAKQVEVMSRYPSLVLVGCEVELINSDGIKLGAFGHHHDHVEIRRCLLLGDGSALTQSAVMIRKSALLKSGFYDERFKTVQYLDLYLRLTEVGNCINLPDILLEWRQHGRSINRTKSATWQSMKRLAISSTIKRIGADAFSEQMFPEVENYFFHDNYFELARLAAKNNRIMSSFELIKRGLLSREVTTTESIKSLGHALIQITASSAGRLGLRG